MLHYASVTQLGWVGAGCVLLALLLLFFSTQVSERTASSREKLLVEHKEEVVEGKTPNLHVALLVAYVVVAVELVLIAAIRHRFFGTSWWLSTLQVVGGGALVFVAALIFGNA